MLDLKLLNMKFGEQSQGRYSGAPGWRTRWLLELGDASISKLQVALVTSLGMPIVVQCEVLPSLHGSTSWSSSARQQVPLRRPHLLQVPSFPLSSQGCRLKFLHLLFFS